MGHRNKEHTEMHIPYNLIRQGPDMGPFGRPSLKFISIPTSTKPILLESLWHYTDEPNAMYANVAGNFAYRPLFRTVFRHATSDPLFLENMKALLKDLGLDAAGIKIDLAHNENVGHQYRLKFTFAPRVKHGMRTVQRERRVPHKWLS